MNSRDQDTFQARAAEARAEAENATLANVRDRALRAEAAWTKMAERAERTEKMRASHQAEKERRDEEILKADEQLQE